MRFVRWLLWKLGRIAECDYLHPNESHRSWEKRQILDDNWKHNG